MKSTRIKAKDLNKELKEAGFDFECSKKDAVERIEDKENNFSVIRINKIPSFFYFENRIIPTIKFLHSQIQEKKQNLLKTITIDMGAVKFVANGADIMRPGITNIDSEIQEDEFIAIIDEKNKVVIAIGKALLCGQEIKEQKTGKSIKSIHYVGDLLWKFQ